MDSLVRLIVWRTILLLATLPLLFLSNGCDARPLPPPLEHGRCMAAMFARSDVTAKRCTYDGQVWLCMLTGPDANTCRLLGSPRPMVRP